MTPTLPSPHQVPPTVLHSHELQKKNDYPYVLMIKHPPSELAKLAQDESRSINWVVEFQFASYKEAEQFVAREKDGRLRYVQWFVALRVL